MTGLLHWTADVLLGVAVAVAIGSGLGVALMPGALQKLHYLSPLSTVVPALVATAISLRYGPSTMMLQAWAVAVLLIGTGPVAAHATARALSGAAAEDARDR